MDKLSKALSLFDAYNKRDPNTLDVDGVTTPLEYFYALELHSWIQRLDPDADEALLLASRSQHIGRWEIARQSYPDGRAGYLRWRSDLGKFHANKASEMMREAGYEDDMIEKVVSIIQKRKLKTDPQVQTMENALCLVFLEFQYEDLLNKQPEEKMISILRKTWGKMSDPGKEQALSLHYSKKGLSLIRKALDLEES